MIFAPLLAIVVARAPSPEPPPIPTAMATATASANATEPTPPVPSAAPASPSLPSPTPKPATPVPVVSPTANPYSYRFVPRQPAHPAPGQPQIFAVYLNGNKLRSHAPIRIKVETSPNVVKVVSRSNGREGTLAMIAAGDFEADSVLPKIPFIAAGMSVDLEFIATGSDGRKVAVRVPVTLGS